MQPPISFIFSGRALFEPAQASIQFSNASRNSTLFDGVAASMLAIREGLIAEKIPLPDLVGAIDNYITSTEPEKELRRDWLERLIDGTRQGDWGCAMRVIHVDELIGIRFQNREEMLELVRTMMQQSIVRSSFSDFDVSCIPPVLEGTLSSMRDPREVVIQFTNATTSYADLLRTTWGVIAKVELPKLALNKELRVKIRAGETEILYQFFRGAHGLRKIFFDEKGNRWDLLGEFPILVHSSDPKKVYIYVDPELILLSRQPLHELFEEAVDVVKNRKGLEEVVLITEAPGDPSRVEKSAAAFVKMVFGPIRGFDGRVTVAAKNGSAIYEVPFKISARGKIEPWGAAMPTLGESFIQLPPFFLAHPTQKAPA